MVATQPLELAAVVGAVVEPLALGVELLRLVLDLALVRRDNDEREIEQLRQALRYAPQDAISAAKLGELLLHTGEYRESYYWLLEAQERNYRLPDGGNRVAQNLRQVGRLMEQLHMQSRLAEELRIFSVSSAEADPAADVAIDI